jgi:hypothetical protein
MLRGEDTVQAGGEGDRDTMTGNGGEATAAFVAALRAASAALADVPGKLEGARVHDAAFGKLFEASEVRDAYHQRLPETEKDIAEARDVIEHFVTGLEGGHPIGPRLAGTEGAVAASEPAIPAQAAAPAAEAAESSGTAHAADTTDAADPAGTEVAS